ncbi:MAG: pilus assembly protein PilM, partial [Myxococcota bacterium]
GLDIGTGAVKAALVTAAARGWTIVDLVEEPIEQGDDLHWPDKAREALARMAGRVKADSVAVALPPGVAVTTRLRLSLTDARKIAAAVGFELESQMPHEIGTVIYDYRVDARDDTGSDLSATYAPRTEIAAALEMLAFAQIDPRLLVSHSHALKFVWRMMDPEKAGVTPCMIVDAGRRHTSICVVDEHDIPFSRTIQFGGDDLESGGGEA